MWIQAHTDRDQPRDPDLRGCLGLAAGTTFCIYLPGELIIMSKNKKMKPFGNPSRPQELSERWLTGMVVT